MHTHNLCPVLRDIIRYCFVFSQKTVIVLLPCPNQYIRTLALCLTHMRSKDFILWKGFRWNLLTLLNTIYAELVPLFQSPCGGTFFKFIFWHYKDVPSLTMEMIFSLHKGSQSLLWAKAQSLWVAWVFPSLSNSSPAQWRNESPRLLKGPTCQRSQGIYHSQPSYCSPDHNRLHGAQPFVINSVVNFCWGNKSVTHLQLRIKMFLPSFFFPSLLSFSLSSVTHCPWQCWPHQKSFFRHRLSWSTPSAKVDKICSELHFYRPFIAMMKGRVWLWKKYFSFHWNFEKMS